jgi:hypothetical protein
MKQQPGQPVDPAKLLDALSKRRFKHDNILVTDLHRVLSPALGNPSLSDFQKALQRLLSRDLIKVATFTPRAGVPNAADYEKSKTPNMEGAHATFNGVHCGPPDVATQARRDAFAFRG